MKTVAGRLSDPIRHALRASRRLRVPGVVSSHSEPPLPPKRNRPRASDAPLTCVPRERPYADFDEAVRLSPRGEAPDWTAVSYRERVPIAAGGGGPPFSRGLEDRSREGVERARNVMLRLENVFPESVMTVAGDWQDEPPPGGGGESSRTIRVGDRFVEIVDVLPFGPLLGTFGMRCVDEVAHVYDSEDRCGFTVVTTDEHDEVGEHSAWVRLMTKEEAEANRIGGRDGLVLESVSSSAFKPHIFGPFEWYARWLQRRAHELGRIHLLQQLDLELSKPENISV